MTDLNRIYGHLEHLWHLQSLLLWSYSAEEYADDLRKEIPTLIDFIQEQFKVSTWTINEVLSLAHKRETNHFNKYFSSIFKIEDIKINPQLNIKQLVTI